MVVQKCRKEMEWLYRLHIYCRIVGEEKTIHHLLLLYCHKGRNTAHLLWESTSMSHKFQSQALQYVGLPLVAWSRRKQTIWIAIVAATGPTTTHMRSLSWRTRPWMILMMMRPSIRSTDQSGSRLLHQTKYKRTLVLFECLSFKQVFTIAFHVLYLKSAVEQHALVVIHWVASPLL